MDKKWFEQLGHSRGDWEWRVFTIHEELFTMGKMQKYILKKYQLQKGVSLEYRISLELYMHIFLMVWV